MTYEHILREGIVKDAVARAHHGFSGAHDVPSHADARRPIAIVRLVQAPRADQDERTRVGINVGKIILLVLDDPEIVVTQAKVDSEVSLHAVAILEISGIGILKSVAVGVAGDLRAVRRRARQEILQGRESWVGAGGVGEVDSPARCAIKDLRDGGAAEFVAELDVVFAAFPGDVLHHDASWYQRAGGDRLYRHQAARKAQR